MHSLQYLRNRFTVKGFLVNSLPKSGTHLLSKAITLLLGNHSNRLHISRYTINQFPLPSSNDDRLVPIGIDSPFLISSETIQKYILNISKSHGIYATCHIPFCFETSDLIRNYKVKTLLILRDPRDIVISHAKYIKNKKDHFLHALYNTFTEEECIEKSITGFKRDDNSGSEILLSISERIHSIKPWMEESYNYTTSFERLIGSRGGGSDEAQLQELRNINHHLGIHYRPKDLSYVATNLFGGTVTFRKGSIGNWRNCFSKNHKELFKDLCGQALIDLGYECDFDW